MESFFAGLAVLAISGVTGLAFWKGEVFQRLYPSLLIAFGVVAAVLAVWNVAMWEAETAVATSSAYPCAEPLPGAFACVQTAQRAIHELRTGFWFCAMLAGANMYVTALPWVYAALPYREPCTR